MTVMLLISFLLLDAMLAGYLWSMPVPRHGEAFFGVRVVSSHMNEHDRRTLRRYRLALVMSVALIESAAIALIARQTGILRFVEIRLAAYAALILSGLSDYIVFARGARTKEPPQEPFGVASALATRRLSGYTNIAFEALIVTATLLPLAVLLARGYPAASA